MSKFNDTKFKNEINPQEILTEIDGKDQYSDNTIDSLLEKLSSESVELSSIALSKQENTDYLGSVIDGFNKNSKAKLIIPIRTDGRFTTLILTKKNNKTAASATYIDLRGTEKTASPSFIQSGINWMSGTKNATPTTTETGSLPTHIVDILKTKSNILPKDITFTTNKIQQPTDNIGEPFLVEILKKLATDKMTVENDSLHERGRNYGNSSKEFAKRADNLSRLEAARQLVNDNPRLISKRILKEDSRIIDNPQRGASTQSIMTAATTAALLASKTTTYLRGSELESNKGSLGSDSTNDIKIQVIYRPTRQPTSFEPTPTPSLALTLPPIPPSLAPSNNPPIPPSPAPSTAKTRTPSVVPSPEPNAAPSTAPTAVSSKVPSQTPSEAPSGQPIAAETRTPSVVPSPEPNAAPSTAPTAVSSKVPSQTPSEAPSGQPIAAATVVPSPAPSQVLTDNPSGQPIAAETRTPSVVPSPEPNAAPSTAPTAVSSKVPSQTPSEAPSGQPIAAETVVPSAVPSQVLTDNPSGQPIAAETRTPSVVPSPEPNAAPSTAPTAVSSKVPSQTPSEAPSGQPIAAATVVPSPAPSQVLTDNPSGQPIAAETRTPSVVPSPEPNAAPSVVPSPEPNAAPSPAATPVPSPAATPVPSPAATPVPSPAATVVPSPAATPVPSPAANTAPSKAPTAVSSKAPSQTPTSVSTGEPSPEPTAVSTGEQTLASIQTNATVPLINPNAALMNQFEITSTAAVPAGLIPFDILTNAYVQPYAYTFISGKGLTGSTGLAAASLISTAITTSVGWTAGFVAGSFVDGYSSTKPVNTETRKLGDSTDIPSGGEKVKTWASNISSQAATGFLQANIIAIAQRLAIGKAHDWFKGQSDIAPFIKLLLLNDEIFESLKSSNVTEFAKIDESLEAISNNLGSYDNHLLKSAFSESLEKLLTRDELDLQINEEINEEIKKEIEKLSENSLGTNRAKETTTLESLRKSIKRIITISPHDLTEENIFIVALNEEKINEKIENCRYFSLGLSLVNALYPSHESNLLKKSKDLYDLNRRDFEASAIHEESSSSHLSSHHDESIIGSEHISLELISRPKDSNTSTITAAQEKSHPIDSEDKKPEKAEPNSLFRTESRSQQSSSAANPQGIEEELRGSDLSISGDLDDLDQRFRGTTPTASHQNDGSKSGVSGLETQQDALSDGINSPVSPQSHSEAPETPTIAAADAALKKSQSSINSKEEKTEGDELDLPPRTASLLQLNSYAFKRPKGKNRALKGSDLGTSTYFHDPAQRARGTTPTASHQNDGSKSGVSGLETQQDVLEDIVPFDVAYDPQLVIFENSKNCGINPLAVAPSSSLIFNDSEGEDPGRVHSSLRYNSEFSHANQHLTLIKEATGGQVSAPGENQTRDKYQPTDVQNNPERIEAGAPREFALRRILDEAQSVRIADSLIKSLSSSDRQARFALKEPLHTSLKSLQGFVTSLSTPNQSSEYNSSFDSRSGSLTKNVAVYDGEGGDSAKPQGLAESKKSLKSAISNTKDQIQSFFQPFGDALNSHLASYKTVIQEDMDIPEYIDPETVTAAKEGGGKTGGVEFQDHEDGLLTGSNTLGRTLGGDATGEDLLEAVQDYHRIDDALLATIEKTPSTKPQPTVIAKAATGSQVEIKIID